MKKMWLLLIAMFLVSCSGWDHSNMTEGGWMDHGEEVVTDETAITEMLADSPRHQEWVEIDNDGKTIHAFVVYPENSENSSAVVLIHENKGLNDWARGMADQVAAEGHIVIAPDLLSSFDDERQMTSDFASPDDATQALYTLDQKDISSDLQAVAVYAESLDSFNGNLVSAWFCWGGSQSFLLADNSDYKASLVFYGSAPEDEAFFENVSAPVYGFYAENDDRINATIEQTELEMQENSNIFQYEIYDGVGHAFMRAADTDASDVVSNEAKNAAFERMKTILSEYK